MDVSWRRRRRRGVFVLRRGSSQMFRWRPPSVGFYSNLEQPWIGVILYGVGANTHKELDLEVLIH
jgi:hypothetical protein